MAFPNWYVYYLIMQAVHAGSPRFALQDVLCDLRDKAQREWPDASPQEVQDFYEHLGRTTGYLTVAEARHLTLMEPWAGEEVIIVQES